MSLSLHRAHSSPRSVKHRDSSGIGLILICSGFLALSAYSVQGQVDTSADAVTIKGKQLYFLSDNQWEPTTNMVKLPFDVEIKTNGIFTVAGGSERRLTDGQIIRKDGYLVEPSGAVQQVFDHVAMLGGTVTVVRDGNAAALTETMVFPNNLTVSPDGSVIYPSGNRSRLADGQLFRLDGTSVAAKDSVTMKDGQVVVLRGGKLIPIGATQTMGMNDGTKVQGDGQVISQDGTTLQLVEGETLLIDGAAARN